MGESFNCNKTAIGGFSIITSRIVGGWVSLFFVKFLDGKQGGKWYFMKDYCVTVKKIIKPFFILL